MKKQIILILAIALTLLSIIYQRLTSPTEPDKFEISIAGEMQKFKLPRSGTSGTDLEIKIDRIPSDTTSFYLSYKAYPSTKDWTKLKMAKRNDSYTAQLPSQAATKEIEYFISYKFLESATEIKISNKTIIARFKNKIPNYLLISHILAMFLAMLFANISGLKAILRGKNILTNIGLSIFFLTIGGLILGPLVQFYAYGQAWTGLPLGLGLTESKTLIAFLVWLITYFRYKKIKSTRWVIFAFILTVIVFLIPHSLFDTALDITKDL